VYRSHCSRTRKQRQGQGGDGSGLQVASKGRVIIGGDDVVIVCLLVDEVSYAHLWLGILSYYSGRVLVCWYRLVCVGHVGKGFSRCGVVPR
jgi:hypothetical protein